jgi:hypothetical protein
MKELHQVQKSEWTQFRGPTASGIASPDANPPTEFGEDKNLYVHTSENLYAFQK